MYSNPYFRVSESVLLASMTIANTLAFVPNITKAARAAKRIFQLTANSSKHINVSELKTNFWVKTLRMRITISTLFATSRPKETFSSRKYTFLIQKGQQFPFYEGSTLEYFKEKQ